MKHIKKIYIGISIIPLILFFVSVLYSSYSVDRSLNTFIPTMVEISYLSVILGIIGVLFIIRGLIKKEAILGLIIATILSGSIALFFIFFGLAWVLS